MGIALGLIESYHLAEEPYRVSKGKSVFGFRQFWQPDALVLKLCFLEVLNHLRGKSQRQRNLLDRSGTEVAPQFASHEVATHCSLGREPKVQIVCNVPSVFPAFIAAAGGDKGWENRA